MTLPPALESHVHALKEALTTERSGGEVFFSVTSLGSDVGDKKALEEHAAAMNFGSWDSDAWRPLSRAEAEALLGRVLHLDLAYQWEAMEHERARELAARFCDLFGPEGHFFSNAEKSNAGSDYGSPPLTGATFDVGVGA